MAEEIRTLVGLDALSDDGITAWEESDHTTLPTGERLQRRLPRKAMAAADSAQSQGWVPRAIHQIWEDFKVFPLITASLSTCKADAARAAFRASGREICWAVIDSGIDAQHPHFQLHGNLQGDHARWHRDFSAAVFNDSATDTSLSALHDGFGHGTHVAGIIAGEIAELRHERAGPSSDHQGFLHPAIRAYRRLLDPSAPEGRR